MPIIETPEGATELTELRGLRHKVFSLGGRKRKLVARVGNIHFADEQDGGKLKDIDDTLRSEQGTGDIVADSLPYRFRLHKNGVGFNYQSRSGGTVSISLSRAGGPFNGQRTYAHEVDGNRITFTDVATDLDIVFIIARAGVRTLRILKSADAPKAFRWRISADQAGFAKLGQEISGRDNLRETPREGRLQRKLELTLDYAPTGTPDEYVSDETWSGRTRYVDPDTRIASWVNDAIYPVEIDPDITEDIVDNNDDGHEYNYAGGTWTSGTTLDLIGRYLGYIFHLGYRFQGIAVPQGATIDLAVLKINYFSSSGGGAGGTVYGDDSDDAIAFSSANRPTLRTRTTASTAFPRFTSSGIKELDVTSIVQEIVDRGGWSTGNDVAFAVVQNEVSGTRWTRFEDYQNVGTNEPSLEIDFTAGGGGLSIPIAMYHYKHHLRTA